LRAAVTSTEARWRDVHSVVEGGDYTFIVIAGTLAANLPRHAFGDEQPYDRGRQSARAKTGQP
jgi:hypothetical protein